MTSPRLDVQARLDAYWSARAPAYHHDQTVGDRAVAARAVWASVWRDALGPAGSRVLDVGTGSGYVAHLLADLGHTVSALDSSPGMIDLARRDAQTRRAARLPAAEFHVDDAVRPTAVGAGFDAITSRYLLWTLRDPAAAVHSWSALLNPGGRIVCVDANWYPDGVDSATLVESSAGPRSFVETYDPPTQQALPLANSTGPSAFADVFRTAGLSEITVRQLDAVVALDARFGVPAGHRSRPQFLISGSLPGRPPSLR
ncbi:MAG: class I SAM-dependent methyltransferase [Gordonia sp. (in: high G+C Gram-positive bacteria)]